MQLTSLKFGKLKNGNFDYSFGAEISNTSAGTFNRLFLKID